MEASEAAGGGVLRQPWAAGELSSTMFFGAKVCVSCDISHRIGELMTFSSGLGARGGEEKLWSLSICAIRAAKARQGEKLRLDGGVGCHF